MTNSFSFINIFLNEKKKKNSVKNSTAIIVAKDIFVIELFQYGNYENIVKHRNHRVLSFSIYRCVDVASTSGEKYS